jgi:hypothetical protein
MALEDFDFGVKLSWPWAISPSPPTASYGGKDVTRRSNAEPSC